MSFSTFIVTGDYAALSPGSVVNGTVTFTPNLGPGSVAHGIDTINIGIIRGVVHAAIVNGLISPTSSFSPNVTLYSSDPNLHLSGPLQYTVDFSNVTVDGVPTAIDSFTFNAPVGSTPIDLIAVSPGYPLPVTPFPYITSSQISDASTIGRQLLTAANQAAEQSILGITTPPVRRPRNNIIVGCGASITTWLTLDSSYMPACFDNFIGHLCLESFQRMRFGGVIGHGGYTQAQIISLYLPTILAMSPAPGACVYFDGPFNDIATNVTLAQTKINLQTVITALTTAGIVPILATVPGHYFTAKHVEMAQWNRYIRRYAAVNGLPLIDLQTAMLDINAAEITAISADTVHPNTQGHKLIAQQALADGLADLFAPNGGTLTSRWIGDLANMLNDGTNNIGLFNFDTNADGVADGWTLNTGLATKCSRVIPAGPDRLLGYWQQISVVTGDTQVWPIKSLTTGFSAGDVLAISARVQTSNIFASGAAWSVGLVQYFAGGYTYPAPGSGSAVPAGYVQSGCVGWLSDVDDGLLYVEVPVLAGATSTFAQIQLAPGAGAGTGVLRIGEFTIVNLTTGAYLS